MHGRPPSSSLHLMILLGAGAMLAVAVTGALASQPADPGRSLVLAAGGLLSGIGGFKLGRMLASGQLVLGRRLCRSCHARRTTRAAFCETCHRRD